MSNSDFENFEGPTDFNDNENDYKEIENDFECFENSINSEDIGSQGKAAAYRENESYGDEASISFFDVFLADTNELGQQKALKAIASNKNNNAEARHGTESTDRKSKAYSYKNTASEETAAYPKSQSTEQKTESKSRAQKFSGGFGSNESDAEKTVTLANIAVIGIVVVIITICLLVLNRSTYSDTERRPLAEFPDLTLKTWFGGDFADGVTKYFSDTVPSRDMFKDIGSSITKYKGISKGGVIIINTGSVGSDNNNNDDDEDIDNIIIAPNKTQPAGSTDSRTEPTTDINSTPGRTEPSVPTDSPTPPRETEASKPSDTPAGDKILYSDGGLVIVGNRAMEIFGGSKKVAKTYALNLNAYKEALGSNVNIYSMVIPVASAFYYNEGSSRSECVDIIGMVSENLSGVTDVPVFNTLDSHKSEYLYLRTDHHWTPLAAYYAWSEFAKKAGIDNPALDSSAYTKSEKTNYLGSLYGLTNSHPALKSAPDSFIYYKPTTRYATSYYEPGGAPREGSALFYEDFKSDYYMLILGSNEKITEIKTDIKNGRRLVIVKDSFGNMLVPYAVTAYEEVYVIDARYFEMNLIEYIQAKKATDVLFACCAFQASSSTPAGNTYVDNIQDIRIR